MEIIINALKNRYIKDNIIFMAGTVLAGVFGYLFHFFIARKLSVAAYGEMQSVFSLVAMFGIFATGFSFFIIKYSSFYAARNDYSANDGFISYINKKIFAAILVISIPLFIFSPLIKNILHLSDIWGVWAAIIAVIFATASVAFQESLRAWQKFFVISFIGVTGAATKLIFGYAIASFSGKASSVIFSIVIASVLGWFLVVYFWKKMRKDATGQREKWDAHISRKKIWKNAVQIFIFSFATALVLNLDILLVKNMTSPEMAGYFSALSILGKIILMLNLSVSGVAFPQACQDGHRGERLRPKVFLLSIFLMIAIGSFIILIYYLIPETLVLVLFGQQYQNISGSLWLFGVMALIMSFFKFETDLAFARHDFRINYLLLFTAIIMTFAVYLYHNTLATIAVSVSASLLIGYMFAIILNNFRGRKKTFEPLI